MSITRMVLLTLGAAVAAVPNSATPSKSCGAGEFRQFDFFAGDWDAYDVAAPSKVVARNKVTIVLGGCVLHEVYEQSDGLVGESFSL